MQNKNNQHLSYSNQITLLYIIRNFICQNDDKTAAAFDLTETFRLLIDNDLIHTDDSGALTAAFPIASYTQITVDGLSADPSAATHRHNPTR